MPSKDTSEKLASVMPPPYPGEYPKIVVPPPGPKTKEWNARDLKVVSQNLTPDYELVTERASGMVVEDLDGNCFLDFAAGISTVSTGHCHPEVVRAVQAAGGAHAPHLLYGISITPPTSSFARRSRSWPR